MALYSLADFVVDIENKFVRIRESVRQLWTFVHIMQINYHIHGNI